MSNKKQQAFDEAVVFRHRLPIQIRFNDVDRYGHVNNNAYFAFYDLGRSDSGGNAYFTCGAEKFYPATTGC